MLIKDQSLICCQFDFKNELIHTTLTRPSKKHDVLGLDLVEHFHVEDSYDTTYRRMIKELICQLKQSLLLFSEQSEA